MQDASQSVVTLDGELMAVNGKLLAANHDLLTSAGGGHIASSYSSINSVCSCTCYPKHHSSPDPRHR